jgi:hypothetical protein
MITNFLIENDIKFEKEKRFDTCKDELSLPFDFYLIDKNILIEYNGEQHYKWKKFFHKTVEEFLLLQNHDKIKSNWAKENNIKLIIIKYNRKIEISLEYLKKEIL